MELNYKILGSTIAAFCLSIVIIVCSFYIGSGINDKAFNLIIIIAGYTIGWFTGILASPYGLSEENRFSEYKKAISAFVGGYILSKIDNTLVNVLSWENLKNIVSAFRLFSFVASFLISLIITFVYRRYAR